MIVRCGGDVAAAAATVMFFFFFGWNLRVDGRKTDAVFLKGFIRCLKRGDAPSTEEFADFMLILLQERMRSGPAAVPKYVIYVWFQ